MNITSAQGGLYKLTEYIVSIYSNTKYDQLDQLGKALAAKSLPTLLDFIREANHDSRFRSVVGNKFISKVARTYFKLLPPRELLSWLDDAAKPLKDLAEVLTEHSTFEKEWADLADMVGRITVSIENLKAGIDSPVIKKARRQTGSKRSVKKGGRYAK